MIVFILIVYLALVWIIFEKLKLATLDLKAKIEVVGIGLIICAAILFALAVVSPYSTNLMVYQYSSPDCSKSGRPSGGGPNSPQCAHQER